MTYSPNRRALLIAGTASLVAPSMALASPQSASRSFRVTRSGSDIGRHRINVSRDGSDVRAQTNIDIAVKFLGITAYRYELAYTEVYRNGLLQTLDATANDDGERGYVKAVRQGDMLEIDGSNYSGPASGTAVPTSYWRMPALQTTPWISAQSGEILSVNTTETQPLPHSPADARVWRATDNGKYTVDIWYDAAGDWTGCSFDAQGELGLYTLESGSGSLTGLAV